MLYIYRNLHRGDAFSIRENGRVIERLAGFVAHDVRFRVSESGRQRVLKLRQKNVHAFVLAARISNERYCTGPEISYNPYLVGNFMCKNEPINIAEAVIFANGKCYLAEPYQNP